MFSTFPAQTRVFVREHALETVGNAERAIGVLSAEVADLMGEPELADSIRLSALQREEEESTFVGQGLAVPHARLPRMENAVVYVTHSVEGLPWPEQAAHVIAFLIVPETRPELHLQLLAGIVRARRDGLL